MESANMEIRAEFKAFFPVSWFCISVLVLVLLIILVKNKLHTCSFTQRLRVRYIFPM